MKRLISIAMVTILLAACVETPIKINEAKIKEEILNTFRISEAGWNEGNWDKYMSSYHKSDSTRFASGGNSTFGWEKVLSNYKKGYPDKSTMGKLTFSEVDLQILSEKYALLFGKWELEREADHPWGLYTLLWEKTDSGWKIVHDHTSSAE